MIESIDSKLISVGLINDYLLIADLHIFVNQRAECASISLKRTKVKLHILNNFVQKPQFSILRITISKKMAILFGPRKVIFTKKNFLIFWQCKVPTSKIKFSNFLAYVKKTFCFIIFLDMT